MTHYTEDAFRGATKLWAHHPLMQPFVSWFLPEMKAVRGHVSNVQKLIQPVLRQRLQDLKDPAFEPPADMLQFLIKNGKADDGRRAAFQAKHQILAAFTAIHTTAMNACHAIYDLAAYPEHVEPLREELTAVLAEEGGIMTKSAMNKLRKLDSFFRETQRVNPANLLGMGRKVTADFRLSDGTLLKKGTFVAFDAQSINHDAELWKDPGRFDGFR
ncbi:MAG: hypothetical protein LQ348_007692 [Seirophora lacunosa]|nr:MAG: hypothetical protein LQ344_002713 [Seirophora lacunosa]KAI4167271.1 MAG: hypothetical protein LQ348_007692 [Seirophora lacunosa]